MIQHSDDATIATYDKALSAFNESGDTAHLDAITPMILEDAKALAVQNGEVSAEDAAGWTIEDALAFSEDAFADEPDVPDAASPVPPSEYQAALEGQQQRQNGKDALSNTSQILPDTGPQASQYAPGWNAMGYSPSRAREAQQQATGRPQTQTDYRARAWSDTAAGSGNFIKTATGYRATPTGEKARQEAGVPLGPNA